MKKCLLAFLLLLRRSHKARGTLLTLSISWLSAAGQGLPGSGNALHFNGSSTYINAGVSNRGITSQITVEAWIKTNSKAVQFAATKYSNSNFEDRGFQLGSSNGFAIFNGRAGQEQYLGSGSSNTYVADGRWHHIAGVCNDNVWQIYVDGTLENSTTYPYSNGNLASTYALSLGSYFVLNNWYFDGDIDEIRVWRTALNQDQIRQNMCRKIAPVPAELVAYYNFDQTSGGVALDQGSVPTNGPLSNFSGNPWQLSGAPLGDASTFAYGSDLRTARPRLAAANGDSAVVSSLTATDGLQLYVVNQASVLVPAAAARATVYFGVFSRGSTSNYDFRLRPVGGPNCSSLYYRPANDAPWATAPATASTATSLLLARQADRAEYIQAGTVIGTVAVAITGDSLLCPGGSLTLTATAAGAQDYRWNTGAITPTLTVTQPGTYSVTATLATGCNAAATFRVVQPSLAIAGDSLLCPGSTLQLTAQAPAATAYRWNTGATTSTLAVERPGSYAVTVTFTGGCTITKQLTVRSGAPAPAFSLGADTTVCEGTAVLLSAPAGNYSYRWSDGTTARTLLAVRAGTYSVQVRGGCNVQTASRTLGTRLCIPNVITPNRDGKNDTFAVSGATGSSSRGDWSLAVYNRWGREVYQTSRYRDDWGADATAGTYYYLLRRPATNTVVKGWLQVIR